MPKAVAQCKPFSVAIGSDEDTIYVAKTHEGELLAVKVSQFD
ncbi:MULTISPECIES: hypothetical protein [Phyllobacterium]|nr:hypothetical protein [Phyllobacterium calauticae]